MSETEAYTHFVEPMRRRFTVPNGIEPDLFSADLAEALATYTVYQLQCAANHFRDHRTQRSFPTIAECRQACDRYAEVAPAAQAHITGSFETNEMKKSLEHTERMNRLQALKMCRCSLGRQAHEEGWLGRLIEYVTDHQKLPNDSAIREIRAKQRLADESLEALRPPVKGSHWSLPEQANLYEKMSGFRQVFIERAYRDVFGFLESRHAAE